MHHQGREMSFFWPEKICCREKYFDFCSRKRLKFPAKDLQERLAKDGEICCGGLEHKKSIFPKENVSQVVTLYM